MYEIRIKKSAKKDLDGKIQRLKNNPFPKGVAKLRGGGTNIELETESTGCFMRLIRRIK